MSVAAEKQVNTGSNGKPVGSVGVPSINHRVEIDSIVVEFQKRLGKNWDDYQTKVSLFLVGKLSRGELMEQLEQVLDKTTIRLHNQLLLANLTNCLRSQPLDGKSGASFGSQQKKRKSTRSSQYEILKKDILSLPIRERKRLKSITRESGKRGMTNSTMALTRQALLPKVPIVTPKPGVPQTKELVNSAVIDASKWAQDVANGLKAPLCTESFELPEKEQLMTRMLGIAREHGITGTIDPDAVDVLSKGLEFHLKSLVENALAIARGRTFKKRKKVLTLTTEDLYDTLTTVPELIDNCGTPYYLSDVVLRNDDDAGLLNLQRGEKPLTPHHRASASQEPTDKPPSVQDTPEKYSSISYLLKPLGAQTPKDSTPRPNLALSDPTIGSPNELNWLLNELLH